jgi:hypothetical protein
MNDRTAREEAAKNAIAIGEMEGHGPSDYCREQLALFVAGEITVHEMWKRVYAYAKREPDIEIAES